MQKLTIYFLLFCLQWISYSVKSCTDVATCLSETKEINNPPDLSNCIEENINAKDGKSIQIIDGDRILGTMVRVNFNEVQKTTGLPLKDANDKKDEGTSWWKLALFGVGLAPVEFFISTAIHEGAHALAIKTVGADVVKYKPYPHVGSDGLFRFGMTAMQGNVSPGENAYILAAPMIVDAVILSGYGGLVLTDTMPKNKYAQTAMLVFAAGHWIDLANHIVARNEYTDTAKIENYFTQEKGWSKTQAQFLVRGSQAATLLVGGYFLFRGGQKIFAEDKKEEKKNRPNSLFQPGLTRKEKLDVLDLHVAPVSDEALMGFTVLGRF